MTDSNDYSDWYSWIEKRVCVKNGLFGTLKYFGNTHFSDGLWCGIELDNQLGKNDGMVNNVRYFTCNSNFGIFIQVSKVTKIKDFPDNFENIANLNETFKIDSSFKKQEVESNSVILERKTVEEKLSNSGLGSTESLGILSLDLIDCDNSWDDFKLNCSLNEDFPNPQNIRENSSYSFFEPAAVSEKELCNTIANPKYASTPRVSKKRLVEYENDSDDSLDAKNHLINKFTYDVHCQKTSEFFFDVDKLKNNPNLTSTYKNLSELTSILNNPELSPVLLGNKNIQQAENLEDFLKDKFSQNSNEILNKTFELHNSSNSPVLCLKEHEKVFDNKNELNVTTIIEDIKSINPEDKKLNANTTFEFQHPSNNLLKLSFEETKDLTFDLKENVKNINEYDVGCKNELNTTTGLENLNANATFELKSPIQIQQILNGEIEDETFHSKGIKNENSNFYECETITATNKKALLLEKTFVFDLSIINECEDSKIQNESFNYKEEFLKETDSFQNSSSQLSYRNSISFAPSFCNEFKDSVRRSSSVSSYPCREKEQCLKKVTRSFNNGGSVSKLKDLHEKNKLFKSPFSPNLTLKNSKTVLKSHSSINSKENKDKTSNKESSNLPRNTLFKNINNKATINTVCKKNEINFKSKQGKSSFNKDNKSEFSVLKSSNSKNSSSKTESNVAAPLKNKLNCQNPKQSFNIASKFYSKTMPVNKIAKNDIQTSTVPKIIHDDIVKDDIKNSKSHLKMPSLRSTLISKNDYNDVSQKSNFPASNVSNKLRIPKRNSLVPCFKDKLPVGVIKPRYSMYQPKTDVLENEEIGKKSPSQTSKVTEKNLNEMNLQSNDKINNSSKECSIPAISNKNDSNIRQFTGLPKKIKNQLNSPSHKKSGLKEPLKKAGAIPTSLKIPVFRKI